MAATQMGRIINVCAWDRMLTITTTTQMAQACAITAVQPAMWK